MRRLSIVTLFLLMTGIACTLFQNCSGGFKVSALGGSADLSSEGAPSGGAVKVWQGTLALPSTVEGPPDLNPPFDQFQVVSNSSIFTYPYTMRTNFTNTLQTQAWRAIFLENEYLKCRILPDLGGHVYSCFDKIANHEMFYANTAIKKQWIGLRGSWAAFGLESNFPNGHSWVTTSPVDFSWKQNSDGSVSASVGNIDRVTSMYWRSEFVLRPGVAMLEQNVSLENRSLFHQPYYWWANAGVRIQDSMDRFDIPTNLVVQHGSNDLDSWPLGRSGQRLDLLSAYQAAAGFFANGSSEDFFGVYQPTLRGGLVHVADHMKVVGKKMWTWGPGTWPSENLSIDGSNYIEIQGGATPDQMTHFFLEPQQVKGFTEYWISAHDLSSIAHASAAGILGLSRSQDSVTLEFQSTRALVSAVIKVTNATSILSTTQAALSPDKNLKITVKSATPVTFQVFDSNQNTFFETTEGKIDALSSQGASLGPAPEPSWKNPQSEADYLAYGDFSESNSNYDFALSLYKKGLTAFPNSKQINKRVGRLLALLNNPSAADFLKQAPSNDVEVQYYLAVVTKNVAGLTSLQSDSTYGVSASLSLAKLAGQTGDLNAALNAVQAGLALAPTNIPLGILEVSILRLKGSSDQALTRALYRVALDPTNFILRYELLRLGKTDSTLLQHLGSDAERVLRVARHYIELGQFEEARRVLATTYPTISDLEREPGVPLPADHPMVWYYLGYCEKKLGQSGITEFQNARRLSVKWVFVKDPLATDVLLLALNVTSDDASALWLLGLNYLASRQIDEAITLFEKVRVLLPSTPSLHRTLGRIYLDIKGDKLKARAVLKEGLVYEPDNADLNNAYQRSL